MSWHQKGKTNLGFTEARDSEWQWHQLGHMQVCISLQTDNHASTPPLSFLQAGCPSCHPTNSVKALKDRKKRKAVHRYKNTIDITKHMNVNTTGRCQHESAVINLDHHYLVVYMYTSSLVTPQIHGLCFVLKRLVSLNLHETRDLCQSACVSQYNFTSDTHTHTHLTSLFLGLAR